MIKLENLYFDFTYLALYFIFDKLLKTFMVVVKTKDVLIFKKDDGLDFIVLLSN